MDVNQLLANIREQVKAILAADEDDNGLAEQVNNLDEWLSKGGFLPRAWQTD